MSQHTIKASRPVFDNGEHVDDQEYEITYGFSPGARAIMYPTDRADPGYPAEIEFVSIKPGAGDHGAFTDLAQKSLEDWASDWLQGDGYDEAVENAKSDLDAARERAAEDRREMRRADR